MTEKKHGREIAFVETYDEEIKGKIEKAFLNHGVSYLIKVKKGLFESKKKFSFYINRYQQEDAKSAMQEKSVDENKIMYLI